MNDKEVGVLWRMKREDIRFMDIHDLIHKLVGERAMYYSVEAPGYGPSKIYRQQALHDFGIKEEEWRMYYSVEADPRIYCRFCGAKLKRDACGPYCETRNCQGSAVRGGNQGE